MAPWRPTTQALNAASLAGFALATSISLAVWHVEGRETLLDRLEYPLLDLRFYLDGPRPAPQSVVIVAIDDETVRDAGSYPLPRESLARLVRQIGERRPKAIGIDMLLVDRAREEADAALESAISDARAILAGAAVFPTADVPVRDELSKLPNASRVLRPLERFRNGTAFGLVNVASDYNGTPRFLPLMIIEDETPLLGFSLRVAAQSFDREPIIGNSTILIGPVSQRLDLGLSLPLRYYGPRGSVTTLSAAAVLRGEKAADVLSDRIAVIGVTAIGSSDTFATPYDPILPGVEILATGIAHLTTGDGLVRDVAVRRIDASVTIGLSLLATAALAFLAPTSALLLIGASIAVWFGVTVAAFSLDLWLSAALPLAAVGAVMSLGLGSRLVLDRRSARRLAAAEQALLAFHPPRLAARIAQDPDFLTEPSQQPASILFLDLSGFTGLSERLGPRRTQRLLKNFHTLVDACVSRHDGFVVSFMGDGAMCVFGLVDPGPDDARRALDAALELVPAIRDWLACEDGSDGSSDVRIGVHRGEVMISRLGSTEHQHIAATGDAVNLASRLMEVGKNLGVALVVSMDLLAGVGETARASASFEGDCEVAIRGRVRPMVVSYRWPRLGVTRPEE